MAKLPLSFSVFLYQSGVDRLEQAFSSSMSQIEAEQEQTYAEYMAYIDSGEDDSEHDLDGENRYLVKSTESDLERKSSEIGLSAQVVRQAFVIAAYHYWEKFAISWTGKRGGIDLRNASPYPYHAKLAALNELSNHLKHRISFERICKLYTEWPELFSIAPYIIPETGKPHWILAVRNDEVMEAVRIVRDSGPVE